MRKRKPSILITTYMLVISILMLATASFAWFTISTSPEISGMQVTLFTDMALQVSMTGEPGTFTQSIDLSECFRDLAPLKPISTVDGKHWFIPSYNAVGFLTPPDEFKLATDANENVSLLDSEGNPLTGTAYMDALAAGYYVSCTFWMQTEYEEDVSVTLSAPDITKDHSSLESWEIGDGSAFSEAHGKKYGSYALAVYEAERDEEGNYTGHHKIDNNSQTALRVGFLIEQDDYNTSERFVVWEPNAEQRSLFTDKPTGEYGYVSGFQLQEEYYKSNFYIPTRPIGPKVVEIAGTDETKIVGELSSIASNNLIVQHAGAWDQEALKEAFTEGNKPNSNDVDYFGKFIKETSSLTPNENGIHDLVNNPVETGLASDTLVVNLQGRDADGTLHPKKVTMCIWIEGQDVDCWNDIAGGSFVINLEFAAQDPKKNIGV